MSHARDALACAQSPTRRRAHRLDDFVGRALQLPATIPGRRNETAAALLPPDGQDMPAASAALAAEDLQARLPAASAVFAPALATFTALTRDALGDQLVALVLYGSVARGEAGLDSDIDLVVVARDWPGGRMAATNAFMAVEDAAMATPAWSTLRAQGYRAEPMPQLWTVAAFEAFSFLHLDLATDGITLYDADGVFAKRMAQVRARMAELGTRRVVDRQGWYWDLKPDFRPGEVITL